MQALEGIRSVVEGWDIDPPQSRSYEERNGIIQRLAAEALAAHDEPACEHDPVFDRSLCVCGVMHNYCGKGGKQLEPCDEPPAEESG